ncbi:metal-dependent hydrolase [Candidatus Woesearchaeota archaeon]|nr:metal-dependent hydrolase [Candidatus Woesearchaeota archaeon]
MLFYTHLVFSILIGIVSLRYFSFQSNILFFASLILFTAFVDIDEPKSKAGKKIGMLSSFLKLIFGHRTFFHSIWFVLAGYILLSFLPYQEVAFGFLFGTASHLILDALTKKGIRPFWPLGFKAKGFVKTGGILEKIFFFLIVVGIILLVF